MSVEDDIRATLERIAVQYGTGVQSVRLRSDADILIVSSDGAKVELAYGPTGAVIREYTAWLEERGHLRIPPVRPN